MNLCHRIFYCVAYRHKFCMGSSRIVISLYGIKLHNLNRYRIGYILPCELWAIVFRVLAKDINKVFCILLYFDLSDSPKYLVFTLVVIKNYYCIRISWILFSLSSFKSRIFCCFSRICCPLSSISTLTWFILSLYSMLTSDVALSNATATSSSLDDDETCNGNVCITTAVLCYSTV